MTYLDSSRSQVEHKMYIYMYKQPKALPYIEVNLVEKVTMLGVD